MRRRPEWVSASDLAEYAYCPRALYYRRAEPNAPETAPEADGRRYHTAVLGAERRRADHGGAIWAGVGLGILVAAIGIAGWIHP